MRISTALIGSIYLICFANSSAFAEEYTEGVAQERFGDGLAQPVLPNVRQIDYRLPVAGSPPPQLAIMDEPAAMQAVPEAFAVGPQDMERIADDTQVVVEGRKLPEWEEIRTYELAYQALNIVDAVQTVAALNGGKVRELNPVLGSNPSTITVVGYKAAWGGMHYLLTRWIMKERPDLARAFQFASIALQGSVVTWNMTKVF